MPTLREEMADADRRDYEMRRMARRLTRAANEIREEQDRQFGKRSDASRRGWATRRNKREATQ